MLKKTIGLRSAFKSEKNKLICACLGTPSTIIPLTKLPTKKVVLCRFTGMREACDLNNDNLSNKEIVKLLCEEILNIWNNAALPTIRKDKAIVKLTKLVENFHSVFKHWEKYETVLFQQNKLKEYAPKLEELFDISVLA